eukprot:11221162-Lingulodinium_polyedra.AAC.1
MRPTFSTRSLWSAARGSPFAPRSEAGYARSRSWYLARNPRPRSAADMCPWAGRPTADVADPG